MPPELDELEELADEGSDTEVEEEEGEEEEEGGEGKPDPTDALVDRLMERLQERGVIQTRAAEGEEEDEEEDAGAGGNAFLQSLTESVSSTILDQLSPVLGQASANRVKGQLKGLTPEMEKVVDELFTSGKIKGSTLAKMANGGDLMFAKAALMDQILAGKITVGGGSNQGEGIGQGQGSAGNFSEEVQREIKAYTAITGKAPTPKELKEWGYL